MDLHQVLEKRATVRQYAPETISADELREMVRLAGLAPSINNSQPWKFIAITNHELLGRMADAVHGKLNELLPSASDEEEVIAKKQVEYFSTFFAGAPAVIAVLSRPYEAIVDKAIAHSEHTHEEINALRGRPDIQSIGAAVENLILAATDKGYGACWLSGALVAKNELEQILGVQEPWYLATMVALGKPQAQPGPRPKKPLEEIFELRD